MSTSPTIFAPDIFRTKIEKYVELRSAISKNLGIVKSKLRYIGSGRFTAAYRDSNDDVILLTFYGDNSKQILSKAYYLYADNPHIPNMERLGTFEFDSTESVQMYRTSYYRPCIPNLIGHTARKTIHALREAHDSACDEFYYDILDANQVPDFNYAVVSNAEGHIPQSMRRALTMLYDVAHTNDFGDGHIFDDFHFRNFGFNNRNKLVLIDPMFSLKVTTEHRRGIIADQFFDRNM